MADVMPDVPNRGQLILVSGLMIAVTLLVLVLLLNTVIYTENVATRGIDSDIGDAASHYQVVEREITAIMARETGEDWGEVQNRVSIGIGMLFDQQQNASIARGHLANGSISSHSPGVNVTNPSLSTNGTLVSDVERSYLFNLSVTSTDWEEGDSLVISIDEDFMSINSTEDGIEVRDADQELQCSTGEVGSNPTFSFVNGTVHADGGTNDCIGDLWIQLADSTESFTIEMEFDQTTSSPVAVEFVGGGASIAGGSEHSVAWFVEETVITLSYSTPELEFQTEHTITQEEAP